MRDSPKDLFVFPEPIINLPGEENREDRDKQHGRTPEIDLEKPGLNAEEIARRREQIGIFPDAQARFEKTAELTGLEWVREVADGVTYPSVDEWVELRLSGRQKGKGLGPYPTFVRDRESNEVYFAKVKIKNAKSSEKFAHEGTVLREVEKIDGVSAPKLIRHIPESDENLEMIVTEAVKFSEGECIYQKEWTPENASSAAKNIRKIEAHSIKEFPDLPQKPQKQLDSLIERSSGVIRPEFQKALNDILGQYESEKEPVFIHGDAWVRNIIVRSDNSTMFIDWELGGAGYKGQDIGRLWWDLLDNDEAKKELLKTYLDEPNEEGFEMRKLCLKFGAIFEGLRWIADRHDVIKREPAAAPRQTQEIRDVEDRVLDMLSQISPMEFQKN